MLPKGAVFHDYLAQYEGGGRLSLLLASLLRGPLVCGYLAPELSLPKQYPILSLVKRPLKPHPLFLLQLILNFRYGRLPIDVNSYKLVLFSGFYSPLAAHRFSLPRVLYCHTPPRYAYDQFSFYYALYPPGIRFFFKLWVLLIRRLYTQAVSQMDLILANSRNVQARVKRYLGLEARVLYPPVETQKFKFLGQEDFYLSVARLDPLKRVDLIVRAFMKMPEKKLVVASGGPELKKIKRLAQDAPNIQILGWVEESRLRRLIGTCLAGIYLPKEEDFGLFPIELMAAGKPVIGVAEGGLKETVIHNKTGLLLPPDPTEKDLIQAVRVLTPQRAKEMKQACEKRAEKFSLSRFSERLESLLHELL